MGGRWHDHNSSPFVSSFMLFRLVPLNTFSNLPTLFGSVSGSQTSAPPSLPPPVNAIPFCSANQDRARELRRTLDISRYKKPFQRERLTTPGTILARRFQKFEGFFAGVPRTSRDLHSILSFARFRLDENYFCCSRTGRSARPI